MREILFKGKRDNGEWVEGSIIAWKKPVILETIFDKKNLEVRICRFEVIPETVGQYTGLTDKNGTKIFEGDIVNIEYNTVVKNAVIEYIGASFYGSTIADNWELDNYYEIEVIGNIHDNPELMKEGAE